jgi:hypothetical protein
MVDIHFADNKDKKRFNCEVCPELTKKRNKCQKPGFQNVRKMRVDLLGGEYTFCPGKATWYDQIALTFVDCRIALEAGIFPSPGSLQDQPEMFADVFYDFMDHWNHRKYSRTLKDAGLMAAAFIEQIFKGLSGKGGKGPMKGR